VAIIELEPDPATGKRRQRQGGSFPTKRVAQEALAEMVSGHWVPPAQVTLGEYLEDEWLPSRAHRAAATRQQYTWAVGHLVSRLGKAKLSRLTPKVIQQVYADLSAEGLSASPSAIRSTLPDSVPGGGGVS